MTAALPIRPSAAPARALRGPAALLLTGLTLLTSACGAPALRHDRQRCLERCRGRPARPAAHSLRPAAGSGRNPAPHALHRRHLDRRLLDLAEPVGLGARPLGQCPASGLYLDASLLCPSWQWRRVRQWSLDCTWPPLRAARPLYSPACGSGPRQRTSMGSHRPPRPHSAGWQPHGLRILSIGRLAYYKGFSTLIRAVAGLPEVQLLIVGDGELRDELQRLISKVTPSGAGPNIHLLGNVDDAEKHALLESCDLFCLASRERTEAFGMVLLEAMHHSRPCIVSALEGSGMPWVVETAGAGITVPAEDVTAWKNAIGYAQSHPALRKQWGAAGKKALNTHFSMEACAKNVSTQYVLAAPDALPSNPSQKDVLIVIPARNEAVTIGALLGRLRSQGWHEILVINDQSTDTTGEIARASGANVLSPVLPIGAWGGMQAGISYALRQGYQAVITMDADGQHEVDEIPVLLQARASADLIVGAFPERASPLRQMAWNWFRRLAGFDLRDLTSGFRLYNREVMEVLASREATLLDYQDLGALLLVRRAGLRIAEVPVSMNLREVGQSRIFNSWFSVAKYMAATTLLCLARWEIRKRRTV